MIFKMAPERTIRTFFKKYIQTIHNIEKFVNSPIEKKIIKSYNETSNIVTQKIDIKLYHESISPKN